MDGLWWKTPIKMDDLGVPLFSETPILENLCMLDIHDSCLPQAADVGWRFGDEIVAVNGKTVASREEGAIWPASKLIKVSMLQNGSKSTWISEYH